EKRILMLHLQNTVHVIYRILEGEKRPRLELRPAFFFRHYESPVNEGLAAPYRLSAIEDRYEISAAHSGLPPLRIKLANDRAQFTVLPQIIHQVVYRIEQSRGYAAGDEVRTVIAGYHWFTDWGRDTMISLEGLALVTGRSLEAGYILRTFSHYVRDGLIPNMFPDGEKEGLYHTADATLWFFHALSRYLHYTDDRTTLHLLLRVLIDIAEYHLRGTRFNIHVDPRDGLLAQGMEGYQLTWM